ncbi:MAG: hypothetical protein KC996_06035 [Phycisphaerales bacterium]|nr:hypothetical protein [Phycisphaerales bacterium]
MNRAACMILAAGLLAGCGSTPAIPDPSPSVQTVDTSRFITEESAWSFNGNPGREYRTPSAIVRTTTDDRIIRGRLPAFVERSVIHYQHAIISLPTPDEPIETYLMGNRPQWEQLTKRLLGDKASIYLGIERGGFTSGQRGVFYDIGPRDSFIICAHEGWHQYSYSAFKDPLPVWLDEGVACFMEGFKWDIAAPDRPRFMPWANTERYDQLRIAASRNALMPLHTILTTRPQDLMARNASGDQLLTWYAQVWAFVHFLYEAEGSRFRAGLQQILLDAAAGNLYTRVEHIVGTDESRLLRSRRVGAGVLGAYLPQFTLRELDLAYQDYIQRITRTGGRDAVVAGQSPDPEQ